MSGNVAQDACMRVDLLEETEETAEPEEASEPEESQEITDRAPHFPTRGAESWPQR